MRELRIEIHIPELSLVLLIGASGSGKSTFARKFFKPSEIISSDTCRAMVSDDENNQAATADAFELARYMAAKRLKNGLLTVIDATNIRKEDRQMWMDLAKEYHFMTFGLVFDMPENLCIERNANRPERVIHEQAIQRHVRLLKNSLRWLKKDGLKGLEVFKSPEEMEAVERIVRTPLYNNKKTETGPFDIIGDVHGCYDELEELLVTLGYTVNRIEADDTNFGFDCKHPEGRRAIFVGDLVDRGPKTPEVLKLVMSMVNMGSAFCVPGNHDVKLKKFLEGRNVQVRHGLAESIEQLSHETEYFRAQVRQFIDKLVSHYVFDEGRLVVSHAGIKEEMQGRGSGAIREFCMYGETTGEIDEFGLPVRYNWAAEYKGKATVVYGHTPVPEAQWLNNTIDIDTGCVFGGKLTALRYPERQLVSVLARQIYMEPVRPLNYGQVPTSLTLQHGHDDVLDIAEVLGKLLIETRLAPPITIRAEQGLAALEVISRFAINPKWLVYLPPTMSPSETSSADALLEHPAEAFAYYRKMGVEKVVCEEKHMGSRAVVIVCRDTEAVLKHFGIEGNNLGVCYTRTGRSFFTDETLEKQFIERISQALTNSGFWDKFNTSWVCLDCELMPWSAKAQGLLNSQYAAAGAAATHALTETVNVLNQTLSRLPEAAQLAEKYAARKEATSKFITAYRQYCWPVEDLKGYKLAPFHILATEGKTWFDKDHQWHMEEIKSFCAADEELLMATPYKIVETNDEASVQSAIDWWTNLTGKGGEGMVVKPWDFITKNDKGLVQPAVKIRGQEYLRIIYGPEYTFTENITRLRNRGLNSKRSLALREFTLGVEALERFVAKEPLRKVHQCIFGIMALESEAVDPRL